MLSIDEMGAVLDDIVDSLPTRMYSDLNGGVLLLPDTKIHPASRNADTLYILGEYHSDWRMGHYIIIYYGSVMKIHGHLNTEALKHELTHILWHELTHHFEFLAGEKGLEIKDEQELAHYMKNNKGK